MKQCSCGRCFEQTPDWAIAHFDDSPGGWPFSGFYWNCPSCGTTLIKPFKKLIESFVEES